MTVCPATRSWGLQKAQCSTHYRFNHTRLIFTHMCIEQSLSSLFYLLATLCLPSATLVTNHRTSRLVKPGSFLRWASKLCAIFDAGRHSWWTASHGSWFIESVCQELKEAMTSSGGVVDVERVLTRVRFHVGYSQETSSGNRMLSGKKQIPSMYSTLTKHLHLPYIQWKNTCQTVLTKVIVKLVVMIIVIFVIMIMNVVIIMCH